MAKIMIQNDTKINHDLGSVIIPLKKTKNDFSDMSPAMTSFGHYSSIEPKYNL